MNQERNLDENIFGKGKGGAALIRLINTRASLETVIEDAARVKVTNVRPDPVDVALLLEDIERGR